MVRDLHHVARMLEDPHRRARRQLARRVPQTVTRHDGVRVHEEHDLAHPARAPRAPPTAGAGAPDASVLLLHGELQRAVLRRQIRRRITALVGRRRRRAPPTVLPPLPVPACSAAKCLSSPKLNRSA